MRETKLGKFIRLSVPEKLDPEESKLWFSTVRDILSVGIIGSFQTQDNDGEPRSVQMLAKRFKSGKTAYEIPLVRSLLDEEVDAVVQEWDSKYPEGQYQIETDSEYLESHYNSLPEIPDTTLEELAVDMAKYNHGVWMNDMLGNGWRYGISFSEHDKTHPLVLPWEQIPEQSRKVNYELPSKFIELMDKYGLLG